MVRCRIFSAAIAVSLTAAPAAAQSLGDVARQQEARRGSAPKAVKTLSNADLDPSAIVAPAGASSAEAELSCYMSKSKNHCVSAEEMISTSVAGALTRENAPFEQRWRSEAGALRSQIEKTQHSIVAFEAIVGDERRSPSERRVLDKNLEGARQSLASLERRWEKLEIAAGNQRVPRKWIEPIPTLTKNQPQQ